ncbi:uncharacterized protein L199_005319 [Kwoniella botswanensis]|uniref:uncharacterized protein n=1 Tax=Kwoniella botswanensis TaxID=1268659 RepID=UPI00315C7E10
MSVPQDSASEKLNANSVLLSNAAAEPTNSDLSADSRPKIRILESVDETTSLSTLGRLADHQLKEMTYYCSYAMIVHSHNERIRNDSLASREEFDFLRTMTAAMYDWKKRKDERSAQIESAVQRVEVDEDDI